MDDHNPTPTGPQAALAEAIGKAGGKMQLLVKLNARGHSIKSHSVISGWERTQVPAGYCPDIEAVSGIPCERLRPDVAWGVLRGSHAAEAPAEQAAA